MKAEERAGALKHISGDLESRAAALKPVERQLSEFEDLLGRWESAQAEAAKGLEQTLARQGAVEALEAEVKNVFELAQRAVDNVQTIGSSRREIDETRALLEDTQNRFQVAEQALRDFEARKRALDRAEQRLARAEALALGIRTTVESAPGPEDRRGSRDGVGRGARSPDEAGGGADHLAPPGAFAGRGPEGRGGRAG